MMDLFSQKEALRLYVKDERREAAREAAKEAETRGAIRTTIEMCQKFGLPMANE